MWAGKSCFSSPLRSRNSSSSCFSLPSGEPSTWELPQRGFPPFSLPKVPVFVASGWCGSKTQRKSVGSWIPTVPRTENLFLFHINVTTLCSSQCVGAERENHHLAQKGKKKKKIEEKILLIAVLAEFDDSRGGEAVWCLQG